jgi:hypothetical protein
MDARHIPIQSSEVPFVDASINRMIKFGPIEFGTGQYKRLTGNLWLFLGDGLYCWRVFDIPAEQLRDPHNQSECALLNEPIDRPPLQIDSVAYMASPKLDHGMTMYFAGFFKVPQEKLSDFEAFCNRYPPGKFQVSSKFIQPVLPKWLRI